MITNAQGQQVKLTILFLAWRDGDVNTPLGNKSQRRANTFNPLFTESYFFPKIK